MTTDNPPSIRFYADELLGRLADWLGHFGAGTYEEITEILSGVGNGWLAVVGLIAALWAERAGGGDAVWSGGRRRGGSAYPGSTCSESGCGVGGGRSQWRHDE